MAATATKSRSRSIGPSRTATLKKAAAKKVVKTAARPKETPGTSKLATKGTRKIVKVVARRAVKSGAQALRSAGARAVRSAAQRGTIAGASAINLKPLPIQVSIDVAVPVEVAWQEWRSWGKLIEGVHLIEDVERDGDSLTGHTAGPRHADWEAEILDEREAESFAWRSVNGSDCAGLATFHELSERLTRIELDLDVLPTGPAEAMTLALHVAHRRAEAELRRFKAHVEFINPDVYEQAGKNNGSRSRQTGNRSRNNGKQSKAKAK